MATVNSRGNSLSSDRGHPPIVPLTIVRMQPLPHDLAPNPRPTLEQVLEGIAKISGQRQVLIRLNSLLEDETRGMQDLVEVVRMDAGICSRVIAAANTTYFRGGTQVFSVEEAMVRVGVAEIRKTLLSSIMRELTLGPLAVYGLTSDALWKRSLLAALAMDVLAQEANRSSDICYTVGLLHPVGMIVLNRWMTNQTSSQPPRIGTIDALDLPVREREACGWTSPELGAGLLESWHFPEAVATAVRHQSAPGQAGRFQGLASLLAAAKWQARHIEAETLRRSPPRPPSKSVLRAAGIEQDAILTSIETVKERFEAFKAAMGPL